MGYAMAAGREYPVPYAHVTWRRIRGKNNEIWTDKRLLVHVQRVCTEAFCENWVHVDCTLHAGRMEKNMEKTMLKK